jgi:cell division protein FtsQ
MTSMFSFRKQGKQGKQGKQAKRKLEKAKSTPLRWRKSYNWILLLLPLLLGGTYIQQLEQFLPIKKISISGSFEYLDQQEIESALRQYIGAGFFSLDIHQLQQQLHQNPWTDSVSVRRVWPDQLRVTIIEKKPVARWDEDHLLSDKASIYLAKTKAFNYLPLMHASKHNPAWVLNQFYQLEARFYSVDEQLVSLTVDSRGALEIDLINGLKIKLGRSDIKRKIERLIAIYQQQILPRREQIEQLDLRYSNGFAVAWKKEVLQAQDKASIWRNSNV